MQQICRRTPIPKCDLNKVALQLLDHETTLEISEFVLNSIEKVKPGFLLSSMCIFSESNRRSEFCPVRFMEIHIKENKEPGFTFLIELRTKFVWSHGLFIEIILWHGCSPVNLLHIFRIPFTKNTSEWLLLKGYDRHSQMRNGYEWCINTTLKGWLQWILNSRHLHFPFCNIMAI